MTARHQAWGEDRVLFFDAKGRLRSLLASWTDVPVPDAFALASAGRSWFRVDDLLRLRALLDQAAKGVADVK
jgi:hypothetical protein